MLKYTVIKHHLNEEKTRIYQNILKLYQHNLPKYTKITKKKPNNTWYIWSKFTLFFYK
jgi:hypothetical protein